MNSRCASCRAGLVAVYGTPVCITCHLDDVCNAIRSGTLQPAAPVHVRELTAAEKKEMMAEARLERDRAYQKRRPPRRRETVR